MPARDLTHTYAGNFATTGLAWREPPMIGFERAGETASNSGNRPPTAEIAYPELLMFEKSRLEPQEAERIVKEMADTVAANWYQIARSESVSVADWEMIKGAFVYAGFWQSGE